jgi:hypothetical protein
MQHKVTPRTWVMLAFFFLLLSACDGNGNNQLVGKWKHQEPAREVTVILEFTKNKLSFSAAGATTASTSYRYIDENTIRVRNPDTGLDVDTSYVIQGDKLTISFIGDVKVEYTRVK